MFSNIILPDIFYLTVFQFAPLHMVKVVKAQDQSVFGSRGFTVSTNKLRGQTDGGTSIFNSFKQVYGCNKICQDWPYA